MVVVVVVVVLIVVACSECIYNQPIEFNIFLRFPFQAKNDV